MRSIYADWEPGDFHSVGWADPEIEYVIIGGPGSGAWAGLDGMAVGWRGWLDAWAEYPTEVDDYRQLDDERALVPLAFPRPAAESERRRSGTSAR